MRRVVVACFVLCSCAGVQAQDGRALAAGCAACHGTGEAPRTAIRALAGMPKDELVGAMRAYRSAERTGTLMPQLAKGYTDAEIDAIAAWYAARPAAR